MRILIIGDSQAEGPAGRILQSRLRGAGHIAERIGHVGHGAYDWTRMHWDEFLAAKRSVHPDHIIMIFGGNDPPDSRLERAFRQFKGTAPNVWYAGPPRYDARPDLQERSRNLRDLAHRVFGAKHLDAWPYSGPRISRAPDNVHFSREGGQIWAEGILRDWTNALRGGVASGAGLPVWVGPVILGGAGVVGLGLFLLSRRR